MVHSITTTQLRTQTPAITPVQERTKHHWAAQYRIQKSWLEAFLPIFSYPQCNAQISGTGSPVDAHRLSVSVLFLCLSPSVCLCLSLPVALCLCLSVSLWVSVCLCVCPLPMCLSACLSARVCLSVSFCLLFVCLPACLPACLSLCQSFCLFVCVLAAIYLISSIWHGVSDLHSPGGRFHLLMWLTLATPALHNTSMINVRSF